MRGVTTTQRVTVQAGGQVRGITTTQCVTVQAGDQGGVSLPLNVSQCMLEVR